MNWSWSRWLPLTLLIACAASYSYIMDSPATGPDANKKSESAELLESSVVETELLSQLTTELLIISIQLPRWSSCENPVSPNASSNAKYQKYLAILLVGCELGTEIDPAILATIAIHESGWYGEYGFGIINSSGGYRTHADSREAIRGLIELISTPGRYSRAWETRSTSDVLIAEHVFLRELVRAGYAEDQRWAWKILWLRDYLERETT